MYDDHVYLKPPPGRTRIINAEHFDMLFTKKNEDELQQSQSNLTKGDQQSNAQQSALKMAGAASLVKGLGKNRVN